jgi:hypothetical protein
VFPTSLCGVIWPYGSRMIKRLLLAGVLIALGGCYPGTPGARVWAKSMYPGPVILVARRDPTFPVVKSYLLPNDGALRVIDFVPIPGSLRSPQVLGELRIFTADCQPVGSVQLMPGQYGVSIGADGSTAVEDVSPDSFAAPKAAPANTTCGVGSLNGPP